MQPQPGDGVAKAQLVDLRQLDCGVHQRRRDWAYQNDEQREQGMDEECEVQDS
jgi:hypothetical protein